MAFDVYVGTMTRFYTRDWENSGQKQSRLNGTHYQMIYAGGDPGEPAPASEVHSVVESWRSGINQSLSTHNLGPIDWSEADGQPYFTDRPGWQGYSALLLWAAYAQRPDRVPPYSPPESWIDDPTFQEVVEKEEALQFRPILQASLWLPGDFRFCFKFPDLTRQEDVLIASTGGLSQELARLRTQELRWQRRSLLDRVRGKSKEESSFESAAHEGLAVFSALADEATRSKLPMLLSF